MRDSLGRLVLWALVPFLAAWAVYYPALEHEYLNWDDPGYVSSNFHVLAGLNQENFLWGLTTRTEANWHPLTWWSLQLDSTLFGPCPESYHFTNVLLHAIASGLFLIVGARILRDVQLALVASLLWAVHPLHVESVAWISERKDVLSVIFWLLATWTYLGYVEKPSVVRMVGVILLLALGLAAKPMLVTFPCTLLLLDYAPLNRLGSRREIVRAIAEKIPLFLLVFVSCAVTLYVQAKGEAVRDLSERSVFQRLEGASVGYGFYLKKTIVPTGLAGLYSHPKDRFYWEMALSLSVVAALTWGAFKLRRQSPLVLVGWLFFLGTLVPVIGLLQVGAQAYANRYVYIPHLGLLMALVVGGAALFDAQRWNRTALHACGIALALVLGVSAREEISHWKNPEALWASVLAVDPDSRQAHNHLTQFAVDSGDFKKALTYANKLITDYPDVATYYVIRVQIHVATNNFELAKQDIAHARSVLTPSFKESAMLLYQEARIAYHDNRPDDAVAALRKAIELDSGMMLYRQVLGMQLLQLGRLNEAQKALEETLALNPAGIEIAIKYAEIALELGEPERGLLPLETALHYYTTFTDAQIKYRKPKKEYSTNKALAHAVLAESLVAANRRDDALPHAREAATFDPEIGNRWAERSWTAATQAEGSLRKSRRTRLGIELALLLAEPERPLQLLDIQAAVLANEGDFGSAIRLAEEVRAVVPATHRAAIEERLALYRAGKPYRRP